MKLDSRLPQQNLWLLVAPVMTVAIIVMVYVLLSRGMVMTTGVSVELPQSASLLTGFEDAKMLTLAMGEPVRVYWDGEPVELSELETILDLDDRVNKRVVIQADSRLPFGRVMEISQWLLIRNFEVGYATDASAQAPRP